MKYSLVLAVETSCDDTSVALVKANGEVIDQLTASQDLQHSPFGGVVPEIASRNHSIALLPLIDEILKKNKLSFKNIDGLAVTNRPGLIGSLIVGVMTIKALSQSLGIPFIGVNHLEGHLLAPFLKDDQYQPDQNFKYPYVALAVSGGHTSLYWVEGFAQYTIIGTTKDDAAGEAFDKFAKMVHAGFPGGLNVDRYALTGDKKKYDFPRSMIHEDNLMMSFSGLKSAAHRLLSKFSMDQIESERPHLCASFQEAIVDVLIYKLVSAARSFNTKNIVITGGVSANSRLRQKVIELSSKGYMVVIPPLRYCTDNAAMIGYAGILHLNQSKISSLNLGPSAASAPEDFKINLYESNK